MRVRSETELKDYDFDIGRNSREGADIDETSLASQMIVECLMDFY